jgi:hypothetical protein
MEDWGKIKRKGMKQYLNLIPFLTTCVTVCTFLVLCLSVFEQMFQSKILSHSKLYQLQ